ncbi:MAG: ChbG/HpnK family deacetylase, partial [Patescibacteria group bacterium]
KLAKEYNINYIRLVNEPFNFGVGKVRRKLPLLYLRWLSKLAANKIKQAKLSSNDLFIGFVNAGNLTKSYLEYANHIARQYPQATVELGCHPGFANETLSKTYAHWGDYHWQQELELLKNYQHG